MALKINRTLILIIVTLICISMSQGSSSGNAPTTSAYYPFIAQDPSRWIGPFGGTVVSILFDPHNPQVAYAGTFGSGVYKSTDGGSTWSPASQGLTNLLVNSMAIDPSNPSILYAGSYRSQVYKSADAGKSWVWSGTGMQDMAIVYSLAVDPTNSSIVYASTRGLSNNGGPPWNGEIYRSTNGGASWSLVLKDLGGAALQDWAYAITVNPYSPNQVLIAAHETGPHRSDNYGSAWYPVDNGVRDFSGRAIAISPDAQHASTYYYGVWHDDTIYKSTDAAGSWWAVPQGYPYQHVYSIALDPQNINNVYLATFVSGILKSTNGGGSWTPSGLAIDDIYSVVIDPSNPTHLLAGTAGDGVHQSKDRAGSWTPSSSGLDNAMVTAVVQSPTEAGKVYASVYGGGAFQSGNRGQAWQAINNGLTDQFLLDLVMDPGHPGVLYGLTETGLFKNDLNTANGWVPAGQGLPLTNILRPAYPPDHPFANLEMKEAFAYSAQAIFSGATVTVPLLRMVYAPSNPSIAYIGTRGSGVYRSNDGGQSWHPAGLGSESINGLAVDQANPDLVYAATNGYGTLKVSANGGQNWTYINLPVTFYSVATSPALPGVAFAGTSDGIYRYQAGSWTSLGLAGQTVTAIRLDPTHPNVIFGGTTSTAYYSVNAGQSWTYVYESLTGQTIQAISLSSIDPGRIYLSTKTHGIFQVWIPGQP